MLNWFRRRRLSAEARRKLLILAARSEEAVTETHVANALALLRELSPEIDLDRGLELYEEIMTLPPALAAAVRTRAFARWDSRAPEGGRFQNPSAEPPKPRAKSRRLEV